MHFLYFSRFYFRFFNPGSSHLKNEPLNLKSIYQYQQNNERDHTDDYFRLDSGASFAKRKDSAVMFLCFWQYILYNTTDVNILCFSLFWPEL